jgi:hypothetical protein
MYLNGLSWRIVLGLNRLSPDLQAKIDKIHPKVAGTFAALRTIQRFFTEHRDFVLASAKILALATQQAEVLAEMAGPQKQAYARELILTFLEQFGVDLDSIPGRLRIAWIDVSIDATVEIFNRHGLFR